MAPKMSKTKRQKGSQKSSKVYLILDETDHDEVVAVFSDHKDAKRAIRPYANEHGWNDYTIKSKKLDEYKDVQPVEYFECVVTKDRRVIEVEKHLIPPWFIPNIVEEAVRLRREPDRVYITTYDLLKALEMAEKAFKRPAVWGSSVYDD